MKLFNETEIASMEEFAENHKKCYEKNNSNKKPLGFTITTKSTGIGAQIKITCDCCGETSDVSDYSTW